MWSDVQKRFAATRRMERKGLWRYLNVNEGIAAELAKESQRYKEPTIDEGQKIRNLWEQVTSKPLTSREIIFYRLIVDSLDWSKYFESSPSEIHEELISLRKDYQALIDRAKFTTLTGELLFDVWTPVDQLLIAAKFCSQQAIHKLDCAYEMTRGKSVIHECTCGLEDAKAVIDEWFMD